MAVTYSAEDLENYLAWIGSKNLMKEETLNGRKVASGKVLAVLDESERQDLRHLDREQVFARFQNAAGSSYSPSSLNAYRSRFTSALDDFIAHHGDRGSYKVAASRAKSGDAPSKKSVKATKPKVLSPSVSPVSHAGATHASAAVMEGLTLPIPLRPGVVVKIFGLPQDLTVAEAKKVSAVVTAYAVIEVGTND